MPDKKKKIRGNDPKWSKPNPRHKGKGMRSIHRESGEWLWRTNGWKVIIWSPNRERFELTVDELWTAEDGNVGWGSWDDGYVVVPSDVRNYIANKLENQ